ncbi:hypothetical protein [Saprospira grandis]|uniref:Lipoprotein n=1 Tax=Saprospira grandis (strain Lewin) TaxID=984262 RepID=H6KZK4_SAPGL|nr:hypothetical protein [Saprospira grandis]AFC25780.1 hypothetical protein SGRA_3052 [Saprospira grandis str. Lewin]
MKFPFLLSLLGLFLFASCTSSRVVRPLEKKKTAFGADVCLFTTAGEAAPIINMQVAHGLSKYTTFYAGTNVSSLLGGVFMADIGFLYGLLKPKGWRPGCSISPRLTAQFNSYSTSDLTPFQPEADLNLYWEYSNRKETANNFLFLNIRNWFESEVGGVFFPQGYRPIISVGHRWQTEKMQLGVEARYMGGAFDGSTTNDLPTYGFMFTAMRLF